MALAYDAGLNCWVDTDDWGNYEPAPPVLTECPTCHKKTVEYKQQAWGDSWFCTDPNCHYHRYFSLGD